MEPLTVRELTQVQTVVFEHSPERPDVPLLMRLLADYLEACGGTLLSVTYHNEDDGDYRESLVAHIECPWQS